MLSDISRVDSGDYFFNTDKYNRIVDYGKNLTRDNRTCEYVGIAKISKNFVKEFKTQLNLMINNGLVNKWWEEVLYALVNKYNIFSLDVENQFWAEVDTIQDFNRIKDYVKSKENSINL